MLLKVAENVRKYCSFVSWILFDLYKFHYLFAIYFVVKNNEIVWNEFFTSSKNETNINSIAGTIMRNEKYGVNILLPFCLSCTRLDSKNR